MHVGLDLELGKVDEDLLEVSASKLEVFDGSSADHVSKVAKDVPEQHTTLINVDALDAVSNLNHLRLRIIDGWLGICQGLSINIIVTVETVVDELGRRDIIGHETLDAGLLIVEFLTILLQLNGVALTVLSLQVVGRAVDAEAAVNHDGKLVAELLSLIHAMRREQH